jgi:hypothetical protein
MTENYEKIAIKNDKIFELREKIENEESKTKYHAGISVRENGFEDSINEFKELMEKFVNNDISKVSNLNELFEQFKTEFDKNNASVIKMKTQFHLLISERNEIIKDIVQNAENNPCINVIKLNRFDRSHKAIEAFQSLAEDHPDKVGFKCIQIMDSDLKQNNARIFIEGDLDTIKNLIKQTNNSKVKYLKTIANTNMEDNFHKHETFNTVFVNSQLIDLNSFTSEDYNVTFNKKINKKPTL